MFVFVCLIKGGRNVSLQLLYIASVNRFTAVCLFFLICAAAAPVPASAQPPVPGYSPVITEAPLPFNRRYAVYWTGIKIADLFTGYTGARLTARIESYGLVKQISKYRSETYTDYINHENGILPKAFFTQFRQRKRTRKIELGYDGDTGLLIADNVTPPDNRKKRPAVAQAAKALTTDPLTAAFAARERVIAARKTGDSAFSLPLYDGRRLSRLDFMITGETRIETPATGAVNTLMLEMRRVPLQGYTNNEKKRMQKEEPVVTVFVSDDMYVMPIKALADAPLGTATIIMEE